MAFMIINKDHFGFITLQLFLKVQESNVLLFKDKPLADVYCLVVAVAEFPWDYYLFNTKHTCLE